MRIGLVKRLRLRRSENVAVETMSLLGTAVINQVRHIGLQRLDAMAATSSAFLGPNKRYKMIQDEASGEATMVQSCYRLLEQLELSGSVEQLLHETIKAQQGALHSGTGSLLFLAGVWSRVALECLHKGIPIPHIMTCMLKGLELCVEVCRRNTVTVEDVVCKAPRNRRKEHSSDSESTAAGLSADFSCIALGNASAPGTFRTKGQPSKVNSLSKPRITLKHSRHFNSSEHTETFGLQTMEASHAQYPKEFDISHLAEAVSHGYETSMSLVIEASRFQSKHSHVHQSHSILDIERLVTCPLPGMSEDNSCVLHGYVVLLCDEQALLVEHLKERNLKVGLVNGDLSDTYRHVGFNRPKNITYVSERSSLTGVSLAEEWLDSALKILIKLGIDVVLVSGTVTKQLKSHCLSHKILVIEHVKVAILNNFATTTGALSVSYITQLNERCVGSGVRVNLVRECCIKSKTRSMVVNVTADGTTLVTAVIASTVHAKLQSLEDQFWACAYRLHHALKDGKLLPGAGAAELLCIHKLHEHMGKAGRTETTGPYEQVILRLMAEGWMDYVSTLWVNSGLVVGKTQAWTHIAQHMHDWHKKEPGSLVMLNNLLNTEDHTEGKEREMLGVYDNMTVKFETWRRALDLVFLVLQTDTEIVVGVNEEETQHNNFMFL